MRRPIVWSLAVIDVAIKVGLAVAIIYMLTHPGLPQFENKSLTLRAVFYPVLALMAPAAYVLRRMRGDYPLLADSLWTFTFTYDIVSNDLHLYGEYENYDDFVHFINALPFMFLLVALLLSLERLDKLRLGYWPIVAVAFTFFVAFHAVWEMWEHIMDRFFGTNLQPGGMVEATDNNFFSILGAFLAVAALYLWRRTPSFETYLIAPTTHFLGQLLGGRPAEAQLELAGRPAERGSEGGRRKR